MAELGATEEELGNGSTGIERAQQINISKKGSKRRRILGKIG